MARREYIIVVVDTIGKWHNAPAPDLVRRAGVSLAVAAKWAQIRRQMSPAGLKRKLRDQVN